MNLIMVHGGYDLRREIMRLIDADAFADFLSDVIMEKKYDTLELDKALTAADCLNAVVHELKGTGIEGFKNCPTVWICKS